MADGAVESRSVERGRANWDWVEVRSGLAEGEEIVVSSQFLSYNFV